MWTPDRRRYLLAVACVTLFALVAGAHAAAASREAPNVILVMTDDQGYGDLACHGNTVIKTPNLDRLHSQSVRLTNFHVSPTCSPTRGALLTGRYNNRTGVWHTIMGRSLLRGDEKTIGDVFAGSGYRTGVFGKWRLVDKDELYDMNADPGQSRDVAATHPAVVKRLRGEYEKWWTSVSTRFDDYCATIIGSPHENPTLITCHDWHGRAVPWNQRMIKSPKTTANGFWAVDVAAAGTYEFTLRRWQEQLP